MGSSARRAAWLLLVCAIALFASSASAFAAPSLGLSNIQSFQAAESEEEWIAIRKSGATNLRTCIYVGLTQGGTDWTFYDKLFENSWRQGVQVLPILCRAPGSDQFPLQAEFPEWTALVEKTVARYGVGGTFWQGKASPLAPTSWEVWNEQNLKSHNPGGTELHPEAYGRLLVATSNAVKNALGPSGASATRILFGGLLLQIGNYSKFLKEAANVPGEANAYDTVSVHSYGSIAEIQTDIAGVRKALDTEVTGAAKRPLWITEAGWPVDFGTTEHPQVTEAQQATLLTESFNWFKETAAANNIQLIDWYNYRDSNQESKWDFRCGLRDEVGNFRPAWYAFQAQANLSRWPNPIVAFQANTGTLWTYIRAIGGANTGIPVKAGTSPSIGQYRGGYKVAFQGSSGTLSTYTPGQPAVNTGLGMQAGTNPSVTPLEDGIVAFHSNSGNLWTYQAGGNVTDSGFGMASGTSPSISGLPRTEFPTFPAARSTVAFQASTGNLWTYQEFGAIVDTKLGMATGTSPAIATLDAGSPRFVVAFQANTGNLWIYEPGGTVADTGYAMKPGTSPSVAALPGGAYVIAFQANTGTMWFYERGGTIGNTGLGMPSGGSPAVAAVGDTPYFRRYEIALNASSGTLWTHEPGGAVINTTYGNQPNTNAAVGPG